VAIGGTAETPLANWEVGQYKTPDRTVYEILGSGSFSVPVTVGQTYLLFIGWDGFKFTFKCDDETEFFVPPAPPMGPPNNIHRLLGTRIYPSGTAFVAATFDDVKINEPPLPIDGEWLTDISGKDKGGAVITCDGNTFEGYGVSLKWGLFNVAGEYSTDFSGNVKGYYTVSEHYTGTEIYSGLVTGKIDKKLSKLTLKLEGGVNVNGIRLPDDDPDIPESWTVKITGGAKGALDPFTIAPYEDTEPVPRLYIFEGSGDVLEDGAQMNLTIDGFFFLTKTNAVYGFYDVDGEIVDGGILTGKITLTSGKFSFTAITSEGVRVTLAGQVKPQ
jgi:hypothetical protein